MVPAHMLADLAIRHAAAFGELCLAMALRHADGTDADGRTHMIPCAMPALLRHETADMPRTGSLEAVDGSFVIAFGRRGSDASTEAWIVAGGIAIHSPDAARIPFRPILCRMRPKRG